MRRPFIPSLLLLLLSCSLLTAPVVTTAIEVHEKREDEKEGRRTLQPEPEKQLVPSFGFQAQDEQLNRCVGDPKFPFCATLKVLSPLNGDFLLLPALPPVDPRHDHLLRVTLSIKLTPIKDTQQMLGNGTVLLAVTRDNTTSAEALHLLPLPPDIASRRLSFPYSLGVLDKSAGAAGTTFGLWLIVGGVPLPGSFASTNFDFRSTAWESLVTTIPGMLEEPSALMYADPVLSPCAPRQEAFTEVYDLELWTAAGAGSGVGSSLDITRFTRRAISDVILRYDIHSVMDVSCGGFTWQPIVFEALSPLLHSVIGLDVVPSVISSAISRFAHHPHWHFAVADVVTTDLRSLSLSNSVELNEKQEENDGAHPNGDQRRRTYPAPDLVLCRDTLAHMCDPDILTALHNIKRSGARYLLVTTQPSRSIHYYRPEEFYDLDLSHPPQFRGGGYRVLNLQTDRFERVIGQPVELFQEGADGKYIGLWDLSRAPNPYAKITPLTRDEL